MPHHPACGVQPCRRLLLLPGQVVQRVFTHHGMVFALKQQRRRRQLIPAHRLRRNHHSDLVRIRPLAKRDVPRDRHRHRLRFRLRVGNSHRPWHLDQIPRTRSRDLRPNHLIQSPRSRCAIRQIERLLVEQRCRSRSQRLRIGSRRRCRSPQSRRRRSIHIRPWHPLPHRSRCRNRHRLLFLTHRQLIPARLPPAPPSKQTTQQARTRLALVSSQSIRHLRRRLLPSLLLGLARPFDRPLALALVRPDNLVCLGIRPLSLPA